MKLVKWSVVAVALSLYCTAAISDEYSTFGLPSQASAADEELTPQQEAELQIERMKRNNVAQNVTDKLFKKQVMDKQAYAKIDKDRSTLYVIEQMLRDKSTPKAERKRLLKQWREIKANEGKHIDEFRAYQRQQQSELSQRADDRKQRLDMDIEQIREQAARRALEEDQVSSSFFNYEKPKPIQKHHYEQKYTFDGPTMGSIDAKMQQQVNDVARKIQEKQNEAIQADQKAYGFFEEEEEERAVHKLSSSYNGAYSTTHKLNRTSFFSSFSNPVYELTIHEEEEEETTAEFDRIFSDEAYKAARENDSMQAPVQIKKPVRTDTLAQAQQLFNGKEGLLLPNTPINMSPEKKEAIRSMIQSYINKQNLTKMKAYERDSLNTLIFNYGLQVLETGEVIALETVGNYGNGTPMIAPDVPVPDTAQQVFVGPEEAFKDFNYQEAQ